VGGVIKETMKTYYYDNLPGDGRLPHDSNMLVDSSTLAALGVFTGHLPDVAQVEAVAKERDYKHRDTIEISKSAMGDAYEQKVENFFKEHMHEDFEARYMLEGNGYFDVRDEKDRWIRVALTQGDLLVLPAGIYHRFCPSTTNYVRALRL
jgi:1,2-dihydroxy-3-keto-5-methylthiopentene dioxygenase